MVVVVQEVLVVAAADVRLVHYAIMVMEMVQVEAVEAAKVERVAQAGKVEVQLLP